MIPNSPPSSDASATFRIEWRPSGLLVIALLLLAVLAPAAVLAGEMPRAAAWLLATAAAVQGLHLAWCERLRPRRRLEFTGDGRLFVDGSEVAAVRISWRGPMAFLSWRDGGAARRHLAWWPDTLAPAGRRGLRLAAAALPAARAGPSMAP